MNNTFLYVITVLIWGSTWIAINYQLGDVSPATSLFYRFGIAAVVLFIFCKTLKINLTFPVRYHLQFLAFGLTLFGCNYYFLYNAQTHINSALTCIAFSMIMIFNIINARIWYKTKITQQVYIGGALGLIGITTLFWPQINDVTLGTQTLLGLAFCLFGTLLASFGNMISMKNQKKSIPLHAANAWGMAYGAIGMAALALAQGASFSIPSSFSYLSSLLYLSIFGSVIAFGSYLTLLNRIGAHKASYASIMFPAIAVIISSFVENFQWSLFTVIGLSFIFIGNWVVLAKPKPKIDDETELQTT
jgi:drug/metabolite transporter (DMT)-like permease